MNTTARQPLRLLCALICAVLPGVLACGASDRADLLIDDVWVIDATGRDPYRASVCVNDGRFATSPSPTSTAAPARPRSSRVKVDT